MHLRLQQNPVFANPNAAEQLGLSVPTVTKALAHLEQLGIVTEITGKQRHRRYACRRYLEILSRGTEPLQK